MLDESTIAKFEQQAEMLANAESGRNAGRERPILDRRYPHAVRGGSWDDDVEDLRSANRRSSRPGWQAQDPQLPKSIW